tara:strand:- start:109 stop:741 length:633 start_codon:yes stop_codon:yes gene_type:complete
MKVDNIDTINMVTNHIRTLNVIDDRVLNVLKKVQRNLFVPNTYKNFAHIDISIPIEQEHMLMPSVEAKLLQALNIKSHENVLVIGSGTGYLSSCVSMLAKRVFSIDINKKLTDLSKSNSKHEYLKNNMVFKHMDILDDLSIIKKYDVTILTSSIANSDIIANNMSNDTRSFIFLGDDDAPIKTGVVFQKLKESGCMIEQVLETNVKALIK